MALLRRRAPSGPQLSRQESMAARPVVSRLVKVDRDEKGGIILQIPRRNSALVKTVSRVFRISPYKRVALDELGTFVIELCDGTHTVGDVVDHLAKRYKLNRREAEVSTTTFLRTLTRRSIIGLVIGEDGPAG